MKNGKLFLVTGAAGHLGTAVVKKLTSLGLSVRALCLDGEKHPPENAQVYYGDVCEKDTLSDFFGGLDSENTVVIHCAGIVSISSKYLQKVHDVNVGGTKNITDLCVSHNIGKLIYVSSVHAIPEKKNGGVITEITDFSPDSVTGLYAKTKAEATAYVFDSVERGLDAEVVFPSGIIGPYDYGRSHTNQFVADYVSGRLTAAVNGGYDFVDVRDVAEGIASCAENGKAGEGYILSGGYHTIRELLSLMHTLTGQREIKTYLPAWFVRMVAPLCELYYKIIREPPLFTGYSIYTLTGNASFSHEKASAALGFSPRSIGTTLADTIEWLKQTSRIPAR